MEILKKGSKGMSVMLLQNYLKNNGYNIQLDSIFGDITLECVIEFQKKNGLVADGIVGEKTWKMLQGNKPVEQIKRKITKIYLHCAATPEGKDFTINDIDKWHKQRGFTKIGYHYVIYRDGSVHKGREESEVGAHVANDNSHTLGICYIGGCDKTGKIAKDTRTDAQKRSMCKLVDELIAKYKLSIKDVYGHYQHPKANKACPSFKIEQFRNEYNEYKHK